MSDDIDVLGSSLLNRQRITRKRTEKRLRRDTRNQAILNVGATGVRLVNKYLEENKTSHLGHFKVAPEYLLHLE